MDATRKNSMVTNKTIQNDCNITVVNNHSNHQPNDDQTSDSGEANGESSNEHFINDNNKYKTNNKINYKEDDTNPIKTMENHQNKSDKKFLSNNQTNHSILSDENVDEKKCCENIVSVGAETIDPITNVVRNDVDSKRSSAATTTTSSIVEEPHATVVDSNDICDNDKVIVANGMNVDKNSISTTTNGVVNKVNIVINPLDEVQMYEKNDDNNKRMLNDSDLSIDDTSTTQHIKNSICRRTDNNDVDNRKSNEIIATEQNSISSEKQTENETSPSITSNSTATFSSEVIDVHEPFDSVAVIDDNIKCNTIDRQHDTKSFSENRNDSSNDSNVEREGEAGEGESLPNGIVDSSTSKESTSLAMDDDSLRTPLLGAASNGIDYNSIDSSTQKQRNKRGNSVKGCDINDINIDAVKSKKVLYNDYVNLMCDTDKKCQSSIVNRDKESDDKRPLITQDGGVSNRRKSIQKSIQKRLSIECTGPDPERPVLHVQFLSEHNRPHSLDTDDNIDVFNSTARPQQSILLNKNPIPSSSVLQSPPAAQQSTSMSTSHEHSGFARRPNTLSNLNRNSITSTSTDSSSSDSSSSESSSSDDITTIAEAKPPDGGWGWVVVFASFMVNLIADGITFSFGIIYVELLKVFGEGKAKTAWIGSLFMAIPLLSGPIASFLTDRYGCRKVTIAGSILASIGFFVSSFTDSIELLIFTFGIFAGFGLSLCYVAAVVIVAYYFDKRRSLATGLSVCGSGIGTSIFAPLTQFLIEEYGWRGTTLILSGLFLNMTVCGLLMRDLEWTTYKSKQRAKAKRKKCRLRVSAESFSVSNSTNTGGTTSNLQKDESTANEIDRSDENGENSFGNPSDMCEDDPRLFSSLITLPTFVKNGEKVPMEVLELLSANRNISNVLLKNYPGLAHSRSFSDNRLNTGRRPSTGALFPLENALSPTSHEHENGRMEENTLGRTSTKSRRIRNEQAFLTWLKQGENGQRPHRMMMRTGPHTAAAYLKDIRMHRHSLTYRGAMLNINRYRLRASSCPDIYRNSMTTIAKEKSSWVQSFEEFKSVLCDMFDPSFFGDIRFTLFALSNFLLYTWYDVPYMYLADSAVQIGYSESDASWLISIMGIVNMFGEIFLGWLGDREGITAGMIYAICMLFCGLITALMPLFPTYGALSALSGCFGLFIAANYALTSIILVELITLDRFTNAYGLLLLVQGIANLGGPPLAGWISDRTGTYDLAFYLAGFFIVISGFFMLILPARGRMKKYRAIKRKSRGRNADDDEDEGDESDDEEDDEDSDVEAKVTNKINSKNVTAPKCVLKYDGTKVGDNKINQV